MARIDARRQPGVRGKRVPDSAVVVQQARQARVQLAVGMGALHPGWLAFERDEGRKARAEKILSLAEAFGVTSTRYPDQDNSLSAPSDTYHYRPARPRSDRLACLRPRPTPPDVFARETGGGRDNDDGPSPSR